MTPGDAQRFEHWAGHGMVYGVDGLRGVDYLWDVRSLVGAGIPIFHGGIGRSKAKVSRILYASFWGGGRHAHVYGGASSNRLKGLSTEQ